MDATPENNPKMPSKAALVAEAIARLDTAGLRSQLLELDTPTLKDLGLWLTDREMSIADAHRMLCAELSPEGAPLDLHIVDYKAVHRFAAGFRGIYQQVRGEHARRIARLTVASATDANVKQMGQVAVNRLVELVAEKMVETKNLEELTATELNSTISTLQGLSNHEIKREELALKTAEAQQRAQKLEEEIAKLRQERSEREARQRAAAQKAIQTADAAMAGGKTISREEVVRMLDAVMKGEA